MTKKTKNKTAVKSAKHPFVGFANFYLTSTDKAKIKEASVDFAAAFDWMESEVESGYAFKFSWDDKSNAHQVMQIGEYTSDFNQGWIQSARHTDLLTAVNALRYQHVVMAGEQQWQKEGEDLFSFDW
uniref:Uncharacterized protein n=1 Tax=uncultured prokaryote TaxID=198431 RepID=A0A0H5QLI1_9ZZZZ|nr:hypothetical protein [uncultured prokaryote]